MRRLPRRRSVKYCQIITPDGFVLSRRAVSYPFGIDAFAGFSGVLHVAPVDATDCNSEGKGAAVGNGEAHIALVQVGEAHDCSRG